MLYRRPDSCPRTTVPLSARRHVRTTREKAMSVYGLDRRAFLQGLGVTAAAAAFGPLLASCSTGSASTSATSTGKPKRGGKATLAIQDTPVNMDPADGQLYASLQVYQNIFSELIEVDADYNYKTNLAASWQLVV